MDVDGVYFQQDSATCQTTGETIGLLREKFPGRVISRNGDYNWPPRSCDLTPLDFFLCDYVKKSFKKAWSCKRSREEYKKFCMDTGHAFYRLRVLHYSVYLRFF